MMNRIAKAPSIRSRCSHFLLAGLIVLAVPLRIVSAATPAQVSDMIDRGKEFLYSRQLNGNWETDSTAKTDVHYPNDPGGLQFGGMTAISTFALLACGENPQSNDHLKAAVAWLEKADMRGTYSVSLRSQIWNLLPQDDAVKKARHRDREMLTEGVRQGRGDESGFFGYGQGIDKRQYDHSVSQFGVLGLWSLAQAGEDVDTVYWRQFDKVWRAQQQKDGSWCYLAEPLTGEEAAGNPGLAGEELSMSAAGVATLFITQDYTSVSAKCEGNIKDANIALGMQWIGSHLDAIDSNDWAKQWRYYTMFGICRIGLASGYKYIGNTDWFKWGGDILLKEQDQSGSWGGGMYEMKAGATPVDGGVWNTAFALLFLSRGRAPVLFNKLQYNTLKGRTTASEANWNQRPRDVANITRLLAKQSETQLNWQIVNLQQPAQDLIDAPLMYMSGNEAIKLSPADMEKLKEYVNEGGIIVGHADCDSVAFADGFRKLGQEMFPGHTFKELPADHPIYTNENFQAKAWVPVPRLEGLDNGARMQMLLMPTGDPGKLWQTQSFPVMSKYPAGQLMMNIYLYAVDKQGLRTKGDTFIVHRRTSVVSDHPPVKIARLQYDGNWNPEPGGWVRMTNYVHNHNKLDIDVEPVELGKGLLTNDYKLADLTGTGTLKLTDEQRAELKKYVDGGGTLLVDAAGGKTAFSYSAKEELKKAFPGTDKFDVLPSKSPVFAVGDPIKEVGYRQYARAAVGSVRVPQLRGVMAGDRVGVFVSNEDLAVGIVGQPVDGIVGYDPASATHIMQNILLYATKTKTDSD